MEDNAITERRPTILIIDDSPEVIDALGAALRKHYRVQCATNGLAGLAVARRFMPDLILLDVVMPGMSGLEVCRQLKSDLQTRSTPVVFITGGLDDSEEELGFSLGAVDYLHKPVKSSLVLQRVRIHLELHHQNLALATKVRERTALLEKTRLEIIRCLGRAAEYRDDETGMHVIRVSHTARLLALAAGVPAEQAELIHQAAQMHDLGKIGIPDTILRKPGALSDDERRIMQAHTLIGAEIIGDYDSELLRTARGIALTHHEKWDGTGYPHGLAGDDIPLEGRIVGVCDVYDALCSRRPYKAAWPAAAALEYLREECHRSFESRLIDLFLASLTDIEAIRKNYADKADDQ